jgi:hypothetical protein
MSWKREPEDTKQNRIPPTPGKPSSLDEEFKILVRSFDPVWLRVNHVKGRKTMNLGQNVEKLGIESGLKLRFARLFNPDRPNEHIRKT